MKRVLLCAAAVAAIAPAAANGAGTNYYFACGGGSLYQGNQPQDWSTTAPATSYTAGGGCGSADPGLLTGSEGGQELDFFAGGEHTGAIQSITFNLDSLLLSQARARNDPGYAITLTVDGDPIYAGTTFRMTPEKSSTGLTERFTFTLGNPPEVETDEEGNETELPPLPLVTGTGKHTIALQFSAGFADYQNIWVWGAAEIPGHVTINPGTTTGPLITPA